MPPNPRPQNRGRRPRVSLVRILQEKGYNKGKAEITLQRGAQLYLLAKALGRKREAIERALRTIQRRGETK